MGLPFAIVCIWVGSALIWVATHGTEAKTPWDVWSQITDAASK